MILITEELRARLLANGAAEAETDHYPVVKLFDPTGAATWLLTELDADGDTLFGLCDLGFGYPELGSVSLAELQSVKGRLGLGIERDLYFEVRFPLSVYAEAARLSGHITEAEQLLRQAATALSNAIPELSPDAARERR
ncbi:DUF2958 domain-containing protein [Mesorhizobium sp. B4-1-4]|uniref:DUF2958 domain-containing protein n=1 Tax=Mesorhizobium sp. B4-1-4 TaxID=2589888 RepID=UPI00112A85FF|nr:DUF2958 domain-containing protein [Mesorhizobium sp. B4-1-4]UCI32116.1 DUF2958 domain-containing protein [Mesorhizobium sp. B4-1-4]